MGSGSSCAATAAACSTETLGTVGPRSGGFPEGGREFAGSFGQLAFGRFGSVPSGHKISTRTMATSLSLSLSLSRRTMSRRQPKLPNTCCGWPTTRS